MSNTSNCHNKIVLTGGAMVLAVTASVFAQEKPFMQAGTSQPTPLPPPQAAEPAATGTNAIAAAGSNSLEKFFNGEIPDAIARGKFNLNVRLRYEQVDDNNIPGITKLSYAPTVRTRFGYTTAPLYGFQGMLEGVNISVLGPEHNYNAAGSNHQGARPPVGDPPMTRLDQAWVGYTSTNYVNFSAKVGQQQINLDNQRFIGDAGWRQNMQTYEAVGVRVTPVKDLNLYYNYVWDVNRVYGDVSGMPAANGDFDSRSHLINVSYSGWEYGRFAGYAYLLDLSNPAPATPTPARRMAVILPAPRPIADKLKVDYRAEFAWQDQYADNPQRYNADYYNFELGANIKPLPLAPATKCWAAAPTPVRAAGGSGSKPRWPACIPSMAGRRCSSPTRTTACRTFTNTRR